MSHSISGTTIKMTRGDTLTTKVSAGEAYTPTANDRLIFGLKKDYTDTECLVQKEIDPIKLLLRIEHSDTKDLDIGTYYYDIEIIIDDGTEEGYYDTFINGAKFIIQKDYVD